MTPAPDMRAGGVPTPRMSAAVRARLRRPRRRREHAPEDRDRQCSVHASNSTPREAKSHEWRAAYLLCQNWLLKNLRSRNQ